MKRLLPRTLVGQILVLVTVLLVITQTINIFLLVGERRIMARSNQIEATIERFADIAERAIDIEATGLPRPIPHRGPGFGGYFLSLNNRAALVRDTVPMPEFEPRLRAALEAVSIAAGRVRIVRRPDMRVQQNFRGIDPPPDAAPSDPLPRFSRHGETAPGPPPVQPFRPRLPPDRNGPVGPGMEEILLSAEIRPGIYLNAMIPYYAAESVSWRIGLATIALLLLASLAGWRIARRIARPLDALTMSADRFGRGIGTTEIPETGPADIRRATRSFNRMQTRIQRLVETQRMMLRALGHDLRSPLTSLRLRAEHISDPAERKKIITTIDEMHQITEEILSWAKDATGTEAQTRVDLSAMLSSMAEDYSDDGYAVTFIEGAPVEALCRRVALRRAIRNLIDNAIKYGGGGELQVLDRPGHILIRIGDRGPGIAEQKLDAVLQPFVRLEDSRNRRTGGTGLGLPIVRTIIEAQGGSLSVRNRETRGLFAELRLPKGITGWKDVDA